MSSISSPKFPPLSVLDLVPVQQGSTPGDALRPYVDRLWCVSWNLEPGEVFEQPILAHPCVNVVIESNRACVYGVPTRIGRQRLTGTGWAVAAIRPASPAGWHSHWWRVRSVSSSRRQPLTTRD